MVREFSVMNVDQRLQTGSLDEGMKIIEILFRPPVDDGLIGAVPTLLVFHQPFGFNAILGLIGLSGILMRNTLILIGQIHSNQADGLDGEPFVPYRL